MTRNSEQLVTVNAMLAFLKAQSQFEKNEIASNLVPMLDPLQTLADTISQVYGKTLDAELVLFKALPRSISMAPLCDISKVSPPS